MSAKVLVIIPMYNFSQLTDKCVELCRKNAGIEHDILVVDDFSDKPYEGDFDLLHRTEQNLGFTAAVNSGLRMARGDDYDYICLLNNDTEPEPDFLKNLVECAQLDGKIGIVGSTRIAQREPYIEFGAGLDLSTGAIEQFKEPHSEPYQCMFVPFCSVLLSKSLIEDIGLLDESLINHCSDNDYCIRAMMMGYGIALCPSSKVFHWQSVTINSKGITPYDDQKRFMAKWLGPCLNEIFDKIPINYELKKYGVIKFEQYEKEHECVS